MLWNRCVRDLQAELPEQEFNTWIRPLQAVEDARVLRLLAPNRFVVEWLRSSTISSGSSRSSMVRARKKSLSSRSDRGRGGSAAPTPATGRPIRPVAVNVTPAMNIESRLNPAFVFSSFVEGKSNQLARAAASQVGQNPGKSYNPLFIYGGVGLGKTHLMHAIGNAMLDQKPDARVAYVHSERFVGDMVRGLQHNKISEFKRSYRSLDALADR